MYTVFLLSIPSFFTGQRVGNVSGYRSRLNADPGFASLIPGRSHIVVEIDHEIIYMAILLPSIESFMKSCCQLQAKVCAQITG